MCVRNFLRISSFLAAIAILSACGDLAEILPSTGTYKVSANVNGLSLDDCSLVSSKAEIQPYFEESVSSDPDITTLVVFLKNSNGENTGVKVTYKLDENYFGLDDETDMDNEESDENEFDKTDIIKDNKESSTEESKSSDALSGKSSEKEEAAKKEEASSASAAASDKTSAKEQTNNAKYKSGDDILFTVKNFDKKLPLYPLADDLPMGRYSIVYQVMGGKQILQRTEKSFFYLTDTVFSFEGIQTHLPGIAENALNIPNGTVVMLEAKLDYDSKLNPYIVWYDGKTIVSEGKFKEGAGNILWKAPDQSGFFSLRAEVFPVLDNYGLSGYSENISLLVSSKMSDLHFLSKDTPGLVHWYCFDGGLKDSIAAESSGWSLMPEVKTSPKWRPAGGIYVLAAEEGDSYSLEAIPLSGEEDISWRIFFRFKPLEKSDYITVKFGPSSDIVLKLSADDKNLVLTLASPSKTVMQEIEMPKNDLFITAGIDFSVQPDMLSAKFFIDYQKNLNNLSNTKPISLEADEINKIDKIKEFKINLGAQGKITAEIETENKAVKKPQWVALWDEVAIINLSFVNEDEYSDNEPSETIEAAESGIELTQEM